MLIFGYMTISITTYYIYYWRFFEVSKAYQEMKVHKNEPVPSNYEEECILPKMFFFIIEKKGAEYEYMVSEGTVSLVRHSLQEKSRPS